MHVWPIEEQWLRPLVTLMIAALAPWLFGAVIRRVVQGRAKVAWRLVLPALTVALGLAGLTALGPVWTAARADPSAWIFAALTVAIGLGSAALEVTRHPAPTDPSAPRGPALATGLVLGVFTIAAVALPAPLTQLRADEAHRAGADAARWRLRVDPWDGSAMLAWAWSARDRDEHTLAAARLAEARRMNVAAAPAFELEAELAASAGDCGRANELFEASLRARAEAALSGEAPLELGGYHLPPTLVRECPELALPAALDLEGEPIAPLGLTPP